MTNVSGFIFFIHLLQVNNLILLQLGYTTKKRDLKLSTINTSSYDSDPCTGSISSHNIRYLYTEVWASSN